MDSREASESHMVVDPTASPSSDAPARDLLEDESGTARTSPRSSAARDQPAPPAAAAAQRSAAFSPLRRIPIDPHPFVFPAPWPPLVPGDDSTNSSSHTATHVNRGRPPPTGFWLPSSSGALSPHPDLGLGTAWPYRWDATSARQNMPDGHDLMPKTTDSAAFPAPYTRFPGFREERRRLRRAGLTHEPSLSTLTPSNQAGGHTSKRLFDESAASDDHRADVRMASGPMSTGLSGSSFAPRSSYFSPRPGFALTANATAGGNNRMDEDTEATSTTHTGRKRHCPSARVSNASSPTERDDSQRDSGPPSLATNISAPASPSTTSSINSPNFTDDGHLSPSETSGLLDHLCHLGGLPLPTESAGDNFASSILNSPPFRGSSSSPSSTQVQASPRQEPERFSASRAHSISAARPSARTTSAKDASAIGPPLTEHTTTAERGGSSRTPDRLVDLCRGFARRAERVASTVGEAEERNRDPATMYRSPFQTSSPVHQSHDGIDPNLLAQGARPFSRHRAPASGFNSDRRSYRRFRSRRFQAYVAPQRAKSPVLPPSNIGDDAESLVLPSVRTASPLPLPFGPEVQIEREATNAILQRAAGSVAEGADRSSTGTHEHPSDQPASDYSFLGGPPRGVTQPSRLNHLAYPWVRATSSECRPMARVAPRRTETFRVGYPTSARCPEPLAREMESSTRDSRADVAHRTPSAMREVGREEQSPGLSGMQWHSTDMDNSRLWAIEMESQMAAVLPSPSPPLGDDLYTGSPSSWFPRSVVPPSDSCTCPLCTKRAEGLRVFTFEEWIRERQQKRSPQPIDERQDKGKGKARALDDVESEEQQQQQQQSSLWRAQEQLQMPFFDSTSFPEASSSSSSSGSSSSSSSRSQFSATPSASSSESSSSQARQSTAQPSSTSAGVSVCREGPESCAICLEPYEMESKLAETWCKHVFHETCVTKWLDKTHQCPLCRGFAPWPFRG